MLKRKVATYHVIKALYKGGINRQVGGINYVAEKVKFLNNYVAGGNYVALVCVSSALHV